MMGVPTSFPGSLERQICLAADVRIVRLVERRHRPTPAADRPPSARLARLPPGRRGSPTGDPVPWMQLSERRVELADVVVAALEAHLVGDAQTVEPCHVTGSVFRGVPIVGAMLIDHLQADESPVHLVRRECCLTSVTQRDVIHAHGQTGSKKNSRSAMESRLSATSVECPGAPRWAPNTPLRG